MGLFFFKSISLISVNLKFNSILGTKYVHFLGSLTSEFLDKSGDSALGLVRENVGA